VFDRNKAAALFEAFVAAVGGLVSIEKVLWDYADSAEPAAGFDLARAMTRAESRTGLGALLGWILIAGSADRSIELGMTLLVQRPRLGGSPGVFYLKLPDGSYEVERLAQWCAVLLDATEGEGAIVWDDDATILETSTKGAHLVSGVETGVPGRVF